MNGFGGGGRAPAGPQSSVADLNMALVQTMQNQQSCMLANQESIKKQQDLLNQLTDKLMTSGLAPLPGMGVPRKGGPAAATVKTAGTTGKKKEAANLGVIRLDYDYPPSPGDVDCPDSFGYDVFYRVVPGLTFAICQSGKLTESVTKKFIEAVRWLDAKGVSGITGDCGFMMYFQKLARTHTSKPVFMSSLAQLPAVTCGYAIDELIAVVTANGETLKPMRALIRDECGVDTEQQRYVFVGCQDVPGFEAVASGDKVDVGKVTPGIVAKCGGVLQKYPKIRAFLFECTELPPYSDAVRAAFGLPVYDSITCCNFFVSGLQDNKRFGINDWQQDWDGKQADYTYGSNLSHENKMGLVNKAA